MQRRGIIIRFIDIGLLLLFGFLMISDLKGTSQISFDQGDAQNLLESADESNIVLGVVIGNDNRLSIRDVKRDRTLHTNVLSIEELEFFIRTLKNNYQEEGKTISILIEPAPYAKIQYVVYVLDVCDRLRLKKNINTNTARVNNES